MIRHWVSLVVVAVLVGCQGPGGASSDDPFVGRTRIAPPRSGAIGAGPQVDPYSGMAPKAAAPAGAATTPGAANAIHPQSPGTAASSLGGPGLAVSAADAGFGGLGTAPLAISNSPVGTAGAASSAAAPAFSPDRALPHPGFVSALASTGSAADRPRVMRTLGPRARAASGPSPVAPGPAGKAAAPAAAPASSAAPIDMKDLPPAPADAIPTTGRAGTAEAADSEVRLTSGVEPADVRQE
jgi:hypothetical protein